MASSTQNQLTSPAQKHIETQQALWTDLSNKTLENVMKLLDLNMTAIKESLGESAAATQQLLSIKSPQELFSLSTAQAKPNIGKVLDYGRQVVGIASNIQAELNNVVQAQINEATRSVSTIVDEASRHSSGGPDGLFAVMKSAIDKSNGGYEQWAKTSKQVAEAMGASLSSATRQFTAGASTTKKASSQSRQTEAEE